MKKNNPILLAGCVLAAIGTVFAAHGQVNVTEHHNHDSRDGLYIDPAFTPAGAAALTRDLAFSGKITGNVYAQPLYIEGGPGGKAMVIAVTESNNVYALDATNGTILWQVNVGPSVPLSGLPCGNLSPYGITGTPIVDLPSRALFFDAMVVNTQTGTPEHLIFYLDVDSGSINPGWPVNVGASATFGSTVFTPSTQGQRGALAIVGTNVYVPYGGLEGDCGTYYGWIVGVPLNNPAIVMAWATSAQGGGVWSVNGVSSDGTSPFMATGNTFNTSSWGGGEAILHFQPNLTLASGTSNYWAPANWLALDNSDTDIGSSGALLVDVPGATPSKLVAVFGKDGNVYLLNRTNLGGISAPVAQASVASGVIIQAAATYRTSKGTYIVYAYGGNLCALRIGASNPPTITSVWYQSEGSGRGSPFVTSTDGTNNVIVWGIGSEGDQRLHAFDGDTGTNIFTGGGANELMGGTRRFNTAIVARGRIYVANDNKVYAFSVPALPVAPIRLGGAAMMPGGAFRFTFTNTPGVSFSVLGTTNPSLPLTRWTSLGSATEVSSGHFQFSDPQATSNLHRFYRVSSP
jgi:outer membrane protein assembly factor BamB